MIAKECYDLIKNAEGLELVAYLDSAGVPTDGYGNTHYALTNKRVKLGDTITLEEAEAELVRDCEAVARDIWGIVKPSLNDNETSALVSFVYNMGIGNFKSSTMLQKLNVGDFHGAAEEFDRWVYAWDPKLKKMVKLAGLVTRRTKEKALFLKP